MSKQKKRGNKRSSVTKSKGKSSLNPNQTRRDSTYQGIFNFDWIRKVAEGITGEEQSEQNIKKGRKKRREQRKNDKIADQRNFKENEETSKRG
jgi:hypothetical protein